MSASNILNEAQNLSSVSARLDSLADQYPAVSEALLVISGNIRDSAIMLELLLRSASAAEPLEQIVQSQSRVSKEMWV